MITNSNYLETDGMIEHLKNVPYDVARRSLYDAHDLYEGYVPSADPSADKQSFDQCFDSRVYHHFMATGKHASSVNESLARALHDHGMHTALDTFFTHHDNRLCIGIMGGHALPRSNPMFVQIALLSKRLTEQGFCMLSGGGPGAMEATHLGAWLAGRTHEEALEAISELSQAADTFKDAAWLSSALSVMRRYPQSRYVSLGIPTWLYGHEPSTPFATHIAKFFENSIREDSILTFAFGGIIYAPGSAGTMQEIFQDAVQNHYLSFGFSSPMVFLGQRFWTEDMPVYPLLQQLMAAGKYKNLLLTLTDEPAEIEQVLIEFREKC